MSSRYACPDAACGQIIRIMKEEIIISGFGGQDTGFGAPQGNSGDSQSSGLFDGFDDLPDTFQAAEDDIPF